MPIAVVRVMLDRAGELDIPAYENGLAVLRDSGFEFLASPAEFLPPLRREVEFLFEGSEEQIPREEVLALCRKAFGTEPEFGELTYISRGTDADARGVLRRFGVSGAVERTGEGMEERVTVSIERAELARVPESRLHTAMEAALNVEVCIVVV